MAEVFSARAGHAPGFRPRPEAGLRMVRLAAWIDCRGCSERRPPGAGGARIAPVPVHADYPECRRASRFGGKQESGQAARRHLDPALHGLRARGAQSAGSATGPPPECRCGAMLRPGVVWFGEGLPEPVWRRAVEAARGAGTFLLVGTSATVYPAAGLVEVAREAGAHIVIVNLEPTPLDGLADTVFNAKAGEILPRLL